uniref:Uncharacterized protein n=1 Tax=Romanomermis culicivorax TaxID=13658 RepID=A0A915I695_ROMCU
MFEKSIFKRRRMSTPKNNFCFGLSIVITEALAIDFSLFSAKPCVIRK